MAYLLVLGNEKGGTGKSTISMHIIIALLHAGRRVASLDLDARQGTLSRYIENRRARSKHFLVPRHISIFQSKCALVRDAEKEEKDQFLKSLNALNEYEYIVIDTPGSDGHLSRLAHSFADTLITPLNDSFIDLDLLVRVSPDFSIIAPSTYSEMVWEQKKQRAMRKDPPMDWIVVRNRIGGVQSRNKETMEKILYALSKRIGFRCGLGLGERVIFKEMFLTGMTLLDMKENQMSISHISAKQELFNLLSLIEFSESRKREYR